MHTSTSRNFRQYALGRYPRLEGNEPFLRFFLYLCFSDFFDKESHRLVIPAKTMAEEFFKQPYTTHFKSGQVLEQFRDEVLPGLTWTEHSVLSPNAWHGKAREIIATGFDEEMQEQLRQECLHPSDDQVDFITGKSYRRESRYRDAAEQNAQYEEELRQFTLNPTRHKILDCMRGLNAGHTFLRKLRENTGKVEDAIERLASEPNGKELQDIQRRILKSIHRNPMVYYLPSQKERTCRLSARGDCILGLKSSVRKALCSGWVECDLRSSQFAILASKLKAPLSEAFLASGESIWRSFYRHTHGVDDAPPKAVKDVFKEAIYSLCFGKSRFNLTWMLKKHGMVKLLSHPILQELLALRAEWFRRIRKDKGALDVWGQWQALDLRKDAKTKKSIRWEGSVAASVIQSIEMEIIAPVFDVAAKDGKSYQFRIVLFQHDGCCISFNSSKKKHSAQQRLKEAVESRARALGVNTVLEFTDL